MDLLSVNVWVESEQFIVATGIYFLVPFMYDKLINW